MSRGTSKRPSSTQQGTENDARVIELRRQQKIAVQNVDFELAEEIDRRIAACRTTDRKGEYDAAAAQFRERTAEIVGGSRSLIADLIAEKEDKERAIRIQINAQFELLQNEHLKALVNYERECAAARLRETERTIPAQEKLLAQARHAGACRLYDDARHFREAADVVAQTDLDCRMARLDEDFDSGRQALLKKQRAEIETLSTRLDHEIRLLDDRLRLTIAKEEELRGVKLNGHLGRQIRDFANSAPPSGCTAETVALEREFATHLADLNCAIPKGIGESARTRPLPKKQPVKIR
jgi:hypothetical protein